MTFLPANWCWLADAVDAAERGGEFMPSTAINIKQLPVNDPLDAMAVCIDLASTSATTLVPTLPIWKRSAPYSIIPSRC